MLRMRIKPLHPFCRLFSAETAPKPKRPGKKEITESQGSAWLESEGMQYDTPASRHWLHPKRPFPKNPWFVPPVPVGDATREEMYALYIQDPTAWTPRRLALQFEVSVGRVEAILRLKHLEKHQMRQGNTLQTTFRTKMEEMLGVGSGMDRLRESVDAGRAVASLSPKQQYRMDPDYEQRLMEKYQRSYTAENDTPTDGPQNKEQERDPLRFVRRYDGNYVMALSGVASEPEPEPVVLEQTNPRETNRRWKFMVTDIGKQQGKEQQPRAMVVREHDGTLRTATLAERRMQERLYPLKEETQREGQAPALWQV